MFDELGIEVQQVIRNAKKEMQELNHPYVGTEHILLAILKNKELKITKRLKKYDLTYNSFKKEIIDVIGKGSSPAKWFLYTPLLKRVIENALERSKNVDVDNLFLSMLEEGEGIAIRILLNMGIDLDKIYDDLARNSSRIYKTTGSKVLLINEIAEDLNAKALNNELDPVIGRDNEIRRVIEILSRRTKNNPILVGDAGVGKTAIVEELSKKIVQGQIPRTLKNKKIMSLDMASIVAGTKYRGEFEEKLKKILKEIEDNPDIIIFIDEIHTLVGAGGAEGAIDASNIFKPVLARNKIRCIGATTIDEYKKYIEKDAALERRFQKVYIEEPSLEETVEILNNIKTIYENFHRVKLSEDVIEHIVNLSNKYIYDRFQPDKAIDLLDEACAKVSLKENRLEKEIDNLKQQLFALKKDDGDIINLLDDDLREKENEIMDKMNNLELEMMNEKKVLTVTKEDVAGVLNTKVKIPIYELMGSNSSAIEKAFGYIRKTIMGQDMVVDKLEGVYKRIKLGFKSENKPYSYMFCGSTGVGKTLMAKEFGKILVGENNIIRMDMSEYSESHSISKIVGSNPGYVGYDDNKNILEQVRNKPYSLLLLDEVEKAHHKVLNLFLQILDEGFVKDSHGRNIRFDNITIIMTTNVTNNKETPGFNKNEGHIVKRLKEYFAVEFINRIDSIVVFKQLDERNIKKIINNKITVLKDKYKSKGISINVDLGVIKDIVKECNYVEFGARNIDKIIKEKLETIIINEILSGKKTISINTFVLN